MDEGEVAEAPIVTDDGSATLYSRRYRQHYHSRHGALSEAQHVFLAGSGVADALAGGTDVRVLEVGFGSGLNFLVSADLAEARGVTLDYLGLERALPSATQLASLDHARHLRHPELAERLLALRRHLGDRRGRWRGRLGRHRLELWLGDARAAELGNARFDAIYHDAFSPDVNPELWTDEFLATLFRALQPGGALVSYTVQGALRRRLARQDFVVEKRPGPPGGKREVLLARKPGPSSTTARG